MNLLEPPAPPVLSGGKRTHRIGKPEELEEETTVPRKTREPKAAAPTLDEAAVKAKGRKKRKYTRHQPMKALRAKELASDVTFAVNEVGAITIAKMGEDGIDLDLADTKRLAVFIERTSTLRK